MDDFKLKLAQGCPQHNFVFRPTQCLWEPMLSIFLIKCHFTLLTVHFRSSFMSFMGWIGVKLFSVLRKNFRARTEGWVLETALSLHLLSTTNVVQQKRCKAQYKLKAF